MTTTAATDTTWGAFTDAGPWVLDDGPQPWQRDLRRVRAEVTASVPELTRRRVLPPGRRMGTTVVHLGGGVAHWAAGARRTGGTVS